MAQDRPPRGRARTLAVAALSALLLIDIALRLAPLKPMTAEGQERGDAAARKEQRRDATVRAVMRAGRVVANISTERMVKRRSGVDGLDDIFDDFFRRYGQKKTRSLGSGIVIDSSGYLLTNAHVVARASRIVATFPDNKSYIARLISASEDEDLALLKVDGAPPLPAIKLGRSKELMIGETVIALGNPFGLENTVTRGVVSARDRRIVRDGQNLAGTFIQTDAAINPGNSGGPLINLDAELVGINTAVHASGQGIGFAIPIDRVRAVLHSLSAPERVADLWLGLDLMELPDGKLRIRAVEEGSPSDAANIAVGDRLLSLDDQALSGVFDFHKRLMKRRSGDQVDLVIAREGRRYRTRLTLRPKPSVAMIRRKLGATASDAPGGEGVLLKAIVPDGICGRMGMAVGDVIFKLSRIEPHPLHGRIRKTYRVGSTEELAGLLRSLPSGETVSLYVQREGRELTGELKLP